MKMITRQKGFTLLEVLAAIMVFAFGMLALYRLQAASVVSNAHSDEITQSLVLGQSRMEFLMSRPYTRLLIDPLLMDLDGDGTDQDLNGDAADDDGGDYGLDDVGAASDWCMTVDTTKNLSVANCTAALRPAIDYRISHNIAVDKQYSQTRTIRVIVTWVGIEGKAMGITHSTTLNDDKSIE